MTVVPGVLSEGEPRPRWRGPILLAASLAVLHLLPLWDMLRLAWRSDFYSHLPLIPIITIYLIRTPGSRPRHPQTSKPGLATDAPASARGLGDQGYGWLRIAFAVVGFLCLAGYWLGPNAGAATGPAAIDRISLGIGSLVSWYVAGSGWLWEGRFLRTYLFPLLFLFFMVPPPSIVLHALEVFFQHASAWAAYAMLSLSGMTMIFDGLIFELPGITLQVAEECSGIRSSLVLLITSLLAGYLFLNSRWNRTWLALMVIPLAIIRNGFRITTIALLCVHVSPDMIDSFIHRKGGPVFFVLSLFPFFLFLWWLRRLERLKAKK